MYLLLAFSHKSFRSVGYQEPCSIVLTKPSHQWFIGLGCQLIGHVSHEACVFLHLLDNYNPTLPVKKWYILYGCEKACGVYVCNVVNLVTSGVQEELKGQLDDLNISNCLFTIERQRYGAHIVEEAGTSIGIWEWCLSIACWCSLFWLRQPAPWSSSIYNWWHGSHTKHQQQNLDSAYIHHFEKKSTYCQYSVSSSMSLPSCFKGTSRTLNIMILSKQWFAGHLPPTKFTTFLGVPIPLGWQGVLSWWLCILFGWILANPCHCHGTPPQMQESLPWYGYLASNFEWHSCGMVIWWNLAARSGWHSTQNMPAIRMGY